MATAVVMPKQGNTVESCIIVNWQKGVGDQISSGDVLCEVETDKATLEVESSASGTILALHFEEGDEVPVLTPIAAVGEPGDAIVGGGAEGAMTGQSAAVDQEAALIPEVVVPSQSAPPIKTPISLTAQPIVGISPRAKNLARKRNIETTEITGTGPGGRIIERDIESAVAMHPRLTPVASRMVDEGEFTALGTGSGFGGRITSKDLIPRIDSPEVMPEAASVADEVLETPVQGVRKVIAERMLHSLQTTAQLTLNTSADARALLAFRKRLKNSAEALGLQGVTIGDLALYAVSRTLLDFRELNALFDGSSIASYKHIHLALAVDAPRGLIVPVIRNADTLSLKQISSEAKRLAIAGQDGRIAPDELSGGTFTVSNLGALGIEDFTPILNPPQVGILGLGNINLKPVSVNGEVQFHPHMGLSLTINHQAVDGAPGARFLQALSKNLADIDLMLAI